MTKTLCPFPYFSSPQCSAHFGMNLWSRGITRKQWNVYLIFLCNCIRAILRSFCSYSRNIPKSAVLVWEQHKYLHELPTALNMTLLLLLLPVKGILFSPAPLRTSSAAWPPLLFGCLNFRAFCWLPLWPFLKGESQKLCRAGLLNSTYKWEVSVLVSTSSLY